MSKKVDLDIAYQAPSKENLKTLYRDWAETYDSEFAKERGYLLPAAVALNFAQAATPEDGPILDIGAGTGLIGRELKPHGFWQIDALDLSAEMLHYARQTGLYRNFIDTSLADYAALAKGAYGAVVSAGTFTHGHLGPEALPEMIDCLRPGGLAVFSINQEHFNEARFTPAFEALGAQITMPEFSQTAIYARETGDAHDGDKALIAAFRKRP